MQVIRCDVFGINVLSQDYLTNTVKYVSIDTMQGQDVDIYRIFCVTCVKKKLMQCFLFLQFFKKLENQNGNAFNRSPVALIA